LEGSDFTDVTGAHLDSEEDGDDDDGGGSTRKM
jgi:hypothetical protein